MNASILTATLMAMLAFGQAGKKGFFAFPESQRPFLAYLDAGRGMPEVRFDRRGRVYETERAKYFKDENLILLHPSLSEQPIEVRAAILTHELRHAFDWTVQKRWIGGGEVESSDAEYRGYEAMLLFWSWVRPDLPHREGIDRSVYKELDARLEDQRRGFLRDYVDIHYATTAIQRLRTLRRRLASLDKLLEDLPARFDLEVLTRRRREYLEEEKLVLRDLELQRDGL